MHAELNINQDYLNYLNIMVDEIESEHLSVFAGAGVSINSGFVDWKGLMKPIIDQLEVSPDMDLALAAQFYENEFGRHDINRLIFNEFNRQSGENRIIQLLGSFPIKSYWTTNYDSLIEDTLSQGSIRKKVDVKTNKDQFKYHVPDHDVTVYKMHGDKRYPDEAIITKNDYEVYDTDRAVFTKALFTELITNTFLFIGFSFSDPNLDRILSIVKHTFDNKAPKNHYCFMRSVRLAEYSDKKQFIQDSNFQRLRIREMRRYGIQTILIDDFEQIYVCLDYIKASLEQRRVFISGTIVNNILNDSEEAEFIKLLAQKLVENRYKIVTGFGQTIGNYLLIGACANKSINETKKIYREIEIYPLVSGGDKTQELRKELISSCGSIITLFGKCKYNQFDESVIQNDGIYQELVIAENLGRTLIPVGCTDYTSKCLWEYVDSTHSNLYSSDKLKNSWQILNNKSISDKEEVISAIIELIEYRNIQEKEKLEVNLLESIGGHKRKKVSPQKVFLSFHYNSSHATAKRLRTLIDKTERYIATEEEKEKPLTNVKEIFDWINEKLENTFATILVYDTLIFESRYVDYEIVTSVKRNNAIIVVCKRGNLEQARHEMSKRYQLDNGNAHFCVEDDIMSECAMLKLLECAENDRVHRGLKN